MSPSDYRAHAGGHPVIEPEEPTPLEQEMHLIVARLREVYDLDSVVLMACRQENIDSVQHSTTRSFALSGNAFAAKHLARRYSEE